MKIKYEISEICRSWLDDTVLKYVSKLGHPSEITYSKDDNGRNVATLTYNIDETKNNSLNEKKDNIWQIYKFLNII